MYEFGGYATTPTDYLNSGDLFDAAAALKIVADEYGVRRYRKQGDETESE